MGNDNVVHQILADAEEQIAADNYERAMEILHFALRRPEFDVRVYEKFAFVLRMSGKHEAAGLFEAVVADTEDAEAYFRLGYQLVQEGMYGSALGPLSRCVQLVPDAAAANYEFAFALMKEFYNEEALHFFMKAYEQEQAMSMTFYIAQLLIFLGRSGEATLFVSKLEEQVKESGEGEMQLEYTKGMLRRYRAHKAETIRDWHFVQYGTLLLRTFEEDYPDEPNHSNGRFTFVNFSYEQVASVLAALQTTIGTIDVFPKYEYVAAAGKASEPLAHAFGRMLMLPVKPLADGLASGQKGIVITSFSDELQEIGADVWERGDVLLFSFALSWTQETNTLPEVIGYLAQAARLPWQERLEFSEDGEPSVIPPDDRPAEEIARGILDRVLHTDMQWVGRIHDYYKERKAEIVAGSQIDVPRKKFFVHSALGGARY
ncbi:tetratricopeptide repeat protein [Effusibacillus consociatus]|uniref:Tetratricopeptide repeat protein n=1 Tax=Effusibacillus consociatus TaxID=1117041 RepID=A0ABV9PXI8_9BACL